MTRPVCITCHRRPARRTYAQCTRCLAGSWYWPIQAAKALGALLLFLGLVYLFRVF